MPLPSWPTSRFAAPTVLGYFGSLVADDRQFPLLEAAASITQDEWPDTDIEAVLADVDSLALRLKERLAADAPVMHRLHSLNRYFFGELGFAGNVNDYQDPANSYLPLVLARRRGIPISLALVYMEIAAQIGLRAQGVSFPGHFLVKLRIAQGEVVIDPFTGQSLSRADLEERLDLLHQTGAARHGPDPRSLALYLQPAGPREIIARMLRNLQQIHRLRGDARRLLVVLDRQRGDVLEGLGRADDAVADWSTYLEHRPDAADAHWLRDRVRMARARRH